MQLQPVKKIVREEVLFIMDWAGHNRIIYVLIKQNFEYCGVELRLLLTKLGSGLLFKILLQVHSETFLISESSPA